MPEAHTEKLYTFLTISLLLVSGIFAGGFYVYQKNLGMLAGEKVQVDSTQTGAAGNEAPVPTRASLADDPVKLSEKSVLKFAIPHDSTGYIVDAHGNKTGLVEGEVMNAIPYSEYAPDKIAGTVNWVVIEDPVELPYVLTIIGEPEKAIAIYALNEAGYEELELVEVPVRVGGSTPGVQNTYTITLDKQAATDMIRVD